MSIQMTHIQCQATKITINDFRDNNVVRLERTYCSIYPDFSAELLEDSELMTEIRTKFNKFLKQITRFESY